MSPQPFIVGNCALVVIDIQASTFIDDSTDRSIPNMSGYKDRMLKAGDLVASARNVGDPAQLFDLSADPMETTNLAFDPRYVDAAAEFAAEVAACWDGDALRDKFIATQKSRRALHAAMEAGASEPRDYNPPVDASQQYVRNHTDWTVAANRYRYPPLKDQNE